MALSEPQFIVTGKDGRLCVVLTPGGVLCIAPESRVQIVKLEQLTEGLPQSEKELVRRIVVSVMAGAVYFHSAAPSPTMAIEVRTPIGTVQTTGADFAVAQDSDQWQVAVDAHRVVFISDGKSVDVGQGQMLQARRDGQGGTTRAGIVESKADLLTKRFDMCQCFFQELDPLVFRPDGADIGGLKDWIGTEGGMVLVGDESLWHDVSPSFRVSPARMATPTAGPATKSAEPGQMTRDLVWSWYRKTGVLRGVNYLPRTAVNTTEMWSKDTYDTKTIDQELDWARSVGYNSVRVPLQFLVWKADAAGFKDRMRDFLKRADARGMTVVFVLFDDSRDSGSDPYLGKQKDPVPGVQNSGWTPSPGLERVANTNAWPELERYVKDVVDSFRRDPRVSMWDLYNTPGNAGMRDRSLPLLEATFRWARSVRPQQPLTSGPWSDFGSPMSARIMELSDVISLQTFDEREGARAKILACQVYRRPVICTDWLKRGAGSTFAEILPVFAEMRVGWFNRGFVRGRTQLFIPKDRRTAEPEPALWEHDVLREDGKPFDEKEVQLIRGFRFTE
jgi:hypothetical protein